MIGFASFCHYPKLNRLVHKLLHIYTEALCTMSLYCDTSQFELSSGVSVGFSSTINLLLEESTDIDEFHTLPADFSEAVAHKKFIWLDRHVDVRHRQSIIGKSIVL